MLRDPSRFQAAFFVDVYACPAELYAKQDKIVENWRARKKEEQSANPSRVCANQNRVPVKVSGAWCPPSPNNYWRAMEGATGMLRRKAWL